MKTSEQKGNSVGKLHKRKEMMEDDKRYIIYYTFGDENAETADPGREQEEKKDV